MNDNNDNIELPSSLEDLNLILTASQESTFMDMFTVNQGESFQYFSPDAGEDRVEVTGEHTIIETNQPQAFVDAYLKQMQERPNENLQFPSISAPLTRAILDGPTPVGDGDRGNAGIPSNNNYRGDFEFDIAFPNQKGSGTKASVNYIFSEPLDKLYIQANVGCIVEFKLNRDPGPGSVIKAQAVFENPEHMREVVKRCPTHVLPNGLGNSGFGYPEHLIRCESDDAIYMIDSDTGRHSVMTRYFPPPVGMESFRSIFKFMCLGSCAGGINRRPLQLIFSLEYLGECLGRRVIHLRICACPARDLKNDEAQHYKKLNGEAPTNKVMKRVCETEMMTVEPPSKKAKEGEEDQVFKITFETRNRATYEMLQSLRETIQLEKVVPPEIAKSYHRRQTQLPCTISSAVGASSSSDSTFSIGLPRTNSLGRDTAHSSSNYRPETVTSEAINIKTEKQESIDSWLQSIGKEGCSQTFMDNNLMQVNQLERLTEDEWKALNIDESEMNEIRSAFNGANVNPSSSQESQSSATNQPGYIRISRVKFKRVSSLKREDQKPQ